MTSPLHDNFTITSFMTSEQPDGDVTPEERWRRLEQLNLENAVKVLPAAVFLLLVAVVGLAGNVLVLLVYGRKFPPSCTRSFILSLACVDVLTCVLSIPGELVDFRFYYNLNDEHLCHFIRFNSAFTSAASGFIIIPMAVDRFRLVCKPMQAQMTIRIALFTIVASLALALVFSLPFVVFTGTGTEETRWSGIRASMCTLSDEFKESTLSLVLAGIHVILLIACTVILVVLYSAIGHAVWKRKRYRRERTRKPHKMTSPELSPRNDVNPPQPPRSPSSSNDIATNIHECQTSEIEENVDDVSNVTSLKACDVEREASISRDAAKSQAEDFEMEDQSCQQSGGLRGRLRSWWISSKCLSSSTLCCRRPPPPPSSSSAAVASTSTSTNDVSLSRTTLIFFLIVVVFILTFLPFYVLVFFRLSDSGFVGRLDVLQSQVYNVFLRTYYLNAASNPLIYSALNPRFRRQCRSLFRRAG